MYDRGVHIFESLNNFNTETSKTDNMHSSSFWYGDHCAQIFRKFLDSSIFCKDLAEEISHTRG